MRYTCRFWLENEPDEGLEISPQDWHTFHSTFNKKPLFSSNLIFFYIINCETTCPAYMHQEKW